VTLGQDWPTEEIKEILEAYDLRIIQRERRRSGPAQWRTFVPPDGRSVYDPNATWTETHYAIRRNGICEACGRQFGYTFEVDQISRVHSAGRSSDGALRREIARQLRRRLRCPYCRAAQKEPRCTLKCQDRRHSALTCGLVLGGLAIVGTLGLSGAFVGGTVGFFVGLLAGLAAALALWFFGFSYALGTRPSI
jgi:hypothetical protein